MNDGDVPASTHATEHRSTTIWRPFVASVSSKELGLADVVSPRDARFWLPLFDRSNERWIVSPGTRPLALTVRRFVDAPVAPKAIVTVPDVTDCDADVDEVNDANVPSDATAAAAPTTPRDATSFNGLRRSADFMEVSFWVLDGLMSNSHSSRSSGT